MNNTVNLQHMRLVSGFLNSENNPAVGVPLSSPSGSIVQPYGGMLGGKAFIDADMARILSNSLVGTLFGGVYQMVRFSATPASFKRGQVVFWDISVAEDLYQVTNDPALVPSAEYKAGIVINADSGSTGGITPGNYGLIQVAGKASVLYRAVLSQAGAVGSQVFIVPTEADCDVLPDAQNLNPPDMGRYIGTAEIAPVGAAISAVGLAAFMNRQ